MPLEYTHTPVTVEGKTTVHIGATSGIGRAIALGFAEEGASVVATSRSADRVERTAEEIRERGSETIEMTCDATDREDIRDLRDAVVEEFGGVDVMVYSASAIARKNILEVSEDEWEDVLDVQLNGAYRSTQLFGREMEDGSILHISSASSITAQPNLIAYATAKGGLDALIRASAWELGPDIRVNAIRPGFVGTEQTKGTYSEGQPRYETIKSRTTQGRLARPGEMVGAAVYLASDAAGYTTGEVITIDDGFIASTFED
ncbi:MAG: SDR family NAD(P)-dependent oxidoreductase [Halodesulfurarchaeum sp.]